MVWPEQLFLMFTHRRCSRLAVSRRSLRHSLARHVSRGAKLCAWQMTCSLRRFRRFHIFGVLTEARFTIAPGAVVERLLRFGDVCLIAFPGFKHRSL